jgi:hypothetical protein
MSSLGSIGVLVALAGVAAPFVILWQRHRALSNRVVAHRQISELERIALRKRGRQSIIAFVLFWLVSLSLVLATALVPGPDEIPIAAFALILLIVTLGITFHLSTRCPICQYWLGYQRTLGVPCRCERCGAEL